MFLTGNGEWVASNLAFGAVLVLALGGVAGLFWYVIRGERLNRQRDPNQPADESGEKRSATREPEGH